MGLSSPWRVRAASSRAISTWRVTTRSEPITRTALPIASTNYVSATNADCPYIALYLWGSSTELLSMMICKQEPCGSCLFASRGRAVIDTYCGSDGIRTISNHIQRWP